MLCATLSHKQHCIGIAQVSAQKKPQGEPSVRRLGRNYSAGQPAPPEMPALQLVSRAPPSSAGTRRPASCAPLARSHQYDSRFTQSCLVVLLAALDRRGVHSLKVRKAKCEADPTPTSQVSCPVRSTSATVWQLDVRSLHVSTAASRALNITLPCPPPHASGHEGRLSLQIPAPGRRRLSPPSLSIAFQSIAIRSMRTGC